MSDGPSPGWLGFSPASLLAIATGVGMAIMGFGRWLGGMINKSRTDENAAREREVAAVNASRDRENAVLTAENERLRKALEKVGAEKDQLTKLLWRVAGSIFANRRNPNVSNEFEEEYPSAVKNMADLIDPDSKHKPDPVLDAMLRGFTDTTPPKMEAPARGKLPSKPSR